MSNTLPLGGMFELVRGTPEWDSHNDWARTIYAGHEARRVKVALSLGMSSSAPWPMIIARKAALASANESHTRRAA